MNAVTRTDPTAGIAFQETDVDTWTVTIDGIDTRSITRDGRAFVAWIGCRDAHMSFQAALNACADHARYHRALCEDALKADAQARALLSAMSPEDRESRIESLGIERDMLDYADSHVDVVARKAALDRQIAAIRRAVVINMEIIL